MFSLEAALQKLPVDQSSVLIEPTVPIDLEDMPAIVVRAEQENVIDRSPYLADKSDGFLGGGYMHNEQGELVPVKVNDGPTQCTTYTSQQFFTVSILSGHKTGAAIEVNSLAFLAQREIARADIQGLYYDGSFPDRPEDIYSMNYYSLVLRYIQDFRVDALATNQFI